MVKVRSKIRQVLLVLGVNVNSFDALDVLSDTITTFMITINLQVLNFSA